jgi:hypothetical protein
VRVVEALAVTKSAHSTDESGFTKSAWPALGGPSTARARRFIFFIFFYFFVWPALPFCSCNEGRTNPTKRKAQKNKSATTQRAAFFSFLLFFGLALVS